MSIVIAKPIKKGAPTSAQKATKTTKKGKKNAE